jgi:SAM-dependent methyltransferase
MNDNQIIELHKTGFKTRVDKYKELFDLEFWKNQESFKIIKKYCNNNDSILEIGCLTGHHLILLAEEGYTDLCGCDFLEDAINWANNNKKEYHIQFFIDEFGKDRIIYNEKDKIILFDVLEHIHNIEQFLKSVDKVLKDNGEVLILVPKGKHFFDPCHVNFYPDIDCLSNLIINYFDIIETYDADNDRKIFMRCRKKC